MSENLKSRWVLPLRLRPLEGKYYQTVVEDSGGTAVTTFVDHGAEESCRFSARQREYYGERWQEAEREISDWHWESEYDYQCALEFCELMNRVLSEKEPR